MTGQDILNKDKYEELLLLDRKVELLKLMVEIQNKVDKIDDDLRLLRAEQ
jgi:hypothetical protein